MFNFFGLFSGKIPNPSESDQDKAPESSPIHQPAESDPILQPTEPNEYYCFVDAPKIEETDPNRAVSLYDFITNKRLQESALNDKMTFFKDGNSVLELLKLFSNMHVHDPMRTSFSGSRTRVINHRGNIWYLVKIKIDPQMAEMKLATIGAQDLRYGSFELLQREKGYKGQIYRIAIDNQHDPKAIAINVKSIFITTSSSNTIAYIKPEDIRLIANYLPKPQSQLPPPNVAPQANSAVALSPPSKLATTDELDEHSPIPKSQKR